jgi:flagellar biosynthetic protein FliO
MNNRQNRGRIIAAGVILGIALIGLFLVTVGRGSEHYGLYASQSTSPSVTDSTAAKPVEGLVGRGAATVSILKMLVALVVVIGCIYLAIYLMKRLMGPRYSGSRKARVLEILETAHIDPKKSLSLVRVADKSVLIGVTDNQISMLTELDSQITLSLMKPVPGQEEEGGFAGILRSASNKFKGLGGSGSQTTTLM